MERTGDDVALDAAVAEIAALVGAFVADGEDLVTTAEERHVETAGHDQLDAAIRQRGQVQRLGPRHRPLTLPSPPIGERVSEMTSLAPLERG